MAAFQTKQQKRAKFALENLPMENNKVNHKLSQFIIGMPNMILSNGIGQTFAFVLSKQAKNGDEKKYGQTFDILKKWLEETMPGEFGGTKNNIEFLGKFNSINQAKYIQSQEECLRLVEWLKRYARAFDEGDKKENKQ